MCMISGGLCKTTEELLGPPRTHEKGNYQGKIVPAQKRRTDSTLTIMIIVIIMIKRKSTCQENLRKIQPVSI